VLWEVFDALAAASSDKRTSLAAQKTKLEAEQVKLYQAHYADAIPHRPAQDRTRPHPRQPPRHYHQARQAETTYGRARPGST
jgi:hypothetical protein